MDPPVLPGPLGRLGRALHTSLGRLLLRGAVWVLAVLSLLAWLLVGANTPPRPHLTNQHLAGAPSGSRHSLGTHFPVWPGLG